MTKKSMAQAHVIYSTERAKGRTQTEAYRAAFPNGRASDATVKRNAKRLEKRPEIVMLIRELQEEAKQKACETAVESIVIDEHIILRELWDNSQQAKAAVPVRDRKGEPTGEYVANWNASNNALIALGKHIGMFKEKADAEDAIDKMLAEMSPEQLRALREALNDAASIPSDAKPVRPKRKGPTTH